MDLATLPAEFERAKTKIAKQDLRSERASGWGSTTSGKALVHRYHERLTEGFRIALLDAHAGLKAEAGLVVTLRGLSPELLALMSIQTLIHSIGMRDVMQTTLMHLGQGAAAECWAAKLTSDETGVAKRIAKAVKARHSNVGRRLAAMETKINDAIVAGKLTKSFKAKHWSPQALVVAGAWLWNVVSTSLPEVFTRETISRPREQVTSVALSEASWGIVHAALDRAMINHPVYWPSAAVPKPWTGWDDGGSWDERVTATVLRSKHKDTCAAVKHAIKSGTMQPALDALNNLQSVPFRINTKVLEVIEQCDIRGIHVDGLVPAKKERLKKPFEWETMDKAQQGRWHHKNSETDKRNRGSISDRILFDEDMRTAFAMLEHGRFYTPMNMDWRGRVYGLSHFNFQREDRVRALFLFDEGAPIGDEGLRWLKIHTANTGDFGKISKRPLEERVQWCDQHIQQIGNIASDPFAHTEWMDADKPFLHLAACFELSAAWEQGSSYVTRLPTSFDGTCSGLQHLCAMTRAEEGALVNLTPAPIPQDIYQVIADEAYVAIAADTENADLAKLILEYAGDRRKVAKRNVMTYAYSSKKFGMASQQQVDLMEPLTGEVLDGKLEEHPFEGYQHGPYDKHGNQQPSKAARVLAHHIYEAIVARITRPAEAMEFLQKTAKALAHEGKPVRWTTPVGIPWINRYHEPVIDRLELFLNDGGVRLRARVNVTAGEKKEIDKAKAANAVAPNAVHSLDASHLLLVANAATHEGIRAIATVHDSFGCLAPQAARFNKIIREQFALMYETHDVLSEILEQASRDLTDANRNRLPTLPQYGSLNLKDIHDADFAFS
jgi:DNA-directed RNA polymerase